MNNITTFETAIIIIDMALFTTVAVLSTYIIGSIIMNKLKNI